MIISLESIHIWYTDLISKVFNTRSFRQLIIDDYLIIDR